MIDYCEEVLLYCQSSIRNDRSSIPERVRNLYGPPDFLTAAEGRRAGQRGTGSFSASEKVPVPLRPRGTVPFSRRIPAFLNWRVIYADCFQVSAKMGRGWRKRPKSGDKSPHSKAATSRRTPKVPTRSP